LGQLSFLEKPLGTDKLLLMSKFSEAFAAWENEKTASVRLVWQARTVASGPAMKS